MSRSPRNNQHQLTTYRHPADLNEEEWSVIFRTNCILSGHHLVEYERFVLDGKDSTKPQTPAPKKDNPPAIMDNEDHNNYKHGSMKKALKVERSPYSGKPTVH